VEGAVADEWIAPLFGGSQQQQLIGLELLQGLYLQHTVLKQRLQNVIARYILDSRAPGLLRCRAIRTAVALRAKDGNALPEVAAALERLVDPAEIDALQPAVAPMGGALMGRTVKSCDEIVITRNTMVVFSPEVKHKKIVGFTSLGILLRRPRILTPGKGRISLK
jgi:hypothetical protein